MKHMIIAIAVPAKAIHERCLTKRYRGDDITPQIQSAALRMTLLPTDGSVSIAGKSPALDFAGMEAVVTVPTFKRPDQLLTTLDSLRAQKTQRPFAIIVMENEAEKREGAKAAVPLFVAGRLPGMVIIAHDRGNCSAYNAGWQTAIRYFPAFRHLLVIDDDEIADEKLARTDVPRCGNDAGRYRRRAAGAGLCQARSRGLGNTSGVCTALL